MICETTVELNSSFGVITTISGFGGGPAGGLTPRGAPSGSVSSSSSVTYAKLATASRLSRQPAEDVRRIAGQLAPGACSAGYRFIVPIQVKPPLVAFEDNDRGYLYWTSQNVRGYVVNCNRNPTPGYLMLHWADCRTINGTQSPWTTRDYAKVCSPSLPALEDWAGGIGGVLQRCEKCWA